MFKKYLLLSCVAAALTACGGSNLDNGPTNSSRPTPPAEGETFQTQWSFSDAASINNWSVEWDKPGKDRDPDNAEPVELYWHNTQFALGIKPNWGGLQVGDIDDPWDSLTVYGMMDAPLDMEYGAIYLSLYYPREHLGNPWGTDPYWGNSTHFMGTQYFVIDSSGNRAFLDAGNGATWLNSFDIAATSYQRQDEEARGNEELAVLADGLWFDLKIESGIFYEEDDDNVSAFDLKSVVGFGLKMSYAHNLAGNNPDDWEGASDKYIFIDDVALVPNTGPPPSDEIEPPEAADEAPEFGLPVFLDDVESGFSNGWAGSGGTWDWASDYAVKSGATSIALNFDGGGSVFQIGGPETTLDLSTVSTFDFSVWVGAGSGTTKLFVSMCDCDDGVEVTVVENEWNNISIPVSSFGKDYLYGAISIKNNSGGSKAIYLDDVGFDKVPDQFPPTFVVPVYFDNAPAAGFGAYDGWGGDYDFASSGKLETGSSAIELAYTGGGAMQIDVNGSDGMSLSGLAAFHFSVYLPSGVDNSDLVVQLCSPGNTLGCGDDEGVAVTAVAGEWSKITIPVADFPSTAVSPSTESLLGEIRIKNAESTELTFYIDNIGFDVNSSPTFALPVYIDGLDEAISQWDGWGGEYNTASDSLVRNGTSNIEAVFAADSYGAYQLGMNGIDVSGYDTFNFSIYVPAGTGDSSIQVQLCGGSDPKVGCGDSDGIWVTAVDGQNRFSLAVSDFPYFPDFAVLDELRIKNATADGKTLYIDDIGFDRIEQPIFNEAIFYDGLASNYSPGGGWGGEYDFASMDFARNGYKSIKLGYTSGWGSAQLYPEGGALDVAGKTLQISAYMPEGGPDTSTIAILFCEGTTGGAAGCGDNDGEQITITAGQWTTYLIPVSDFVPITSLGEIRLKDNQNTGQTVYVDSIGFID